MDIIKLKEAFRTLSQLKVKSVVLPYKEYYETKETFRLNSDDGGSHEHRSQRDDPPSLTVFGVRVKRDGLV